ncbi:WD40-repeat-containing domain protein [Aspergillus avenaceus]|uniref:Pre-mRNA-processing factor 19 n=1 Tax=Aspergillus avenaceus TaxID=36643 RepID=A0A5N6U8M8_ASPAV|nr:WD40-repeat-containing domain protein [Aspergillus avenaceus]
MLCAISGEAPQVPVVSPKSGNVFEKRLIEAYIAEHGKDPVNGEELSTDDLIDVKSQRVVRPRPPTLTSIPSLLNVFQEEWDALALETYTLRQTLAQTRQELSTALYQNDAAVRVIARLTQERDEARDALSKVSVGASRPSAAGGEAMQVDSTGLPESVLSRIESTQASLSKTRRKRPVPENWATSDAVSTFKPSQSSEPLFPGGTALSVNSTGELALVGGADGVVGIYSLPQQQIIQNLQASGPVTDAVWAGDKAVIASSTGSVKVFENGNEVADFNSHAGAATALAVHATGDIVASVGADKSYVLYDLTTNAVITQVFSGASLLSVKFHPDGHLIAAGGVDGQVQIFDVKNGSQAANFTMSGPVKCLFFSENGTFMAAVAENSTVVSIWDLRSAQEVKALETGSPVDSVNWDYTGQYLLTGGPSGLTVQQYTKATKSWSEPLRSAVPAAAVAWGAAAQSIVALNRDGGVTVLSAQ